MSNSAMIAIAALFAAAAVPAGAEQWDVTKDKSLVVHRLAATDLRMTVVCDPEGAFSPPQNYLFVERRGQRVETGQLTVSEGDDSVNLPIIGAAAVPTGNVENWNRGVFPASRFGAATSDEVSTVPSRSWRCDVR